MPFKFFRVLPRVLSASIFTAIFYIFAAMPASAQADDKGEHKAPDVVKVGLFLNPPFVMKHNGRYVGMAVDLWENIAKQIGVSSEYIEFDSIRELVDSVEAAKVDIAVTNLTITSKRAARIDFTQPWFDSGLRILVSDDPQIGFAKVLGGLSDSGFLRAYIWLGLVLLGATVLLTLFDRRFDKEFPRRWRDGTAESFFTVMTVVSSGRLPARKNLFGWIGRFAQAIWLICGVVVLTYVTSSITSVMTTLSLANQIESLSDLPGKEAGVLSGSVSEEFAHEQIIGSRSFNNLDQAINSLLGGGVDAVIEDAPVLEYFVHKHPDLPLRVVGPIFEPEKYGFGISPGSPMLGRTTIEILEANEEDYIESLRIKYFGD